MTKNVFATDTVTHQWAHKAQESARNANGSVFFNNGVLYSYGDHFVIGAHLDNGRIIWNTDTHSKTTSKHQCIAQRALTAQQREQALYVPELNHSLFSDLMQAKRDGKGATMPELVNVCASKLVKAVQSMAGMRESANRIQETFFDAQVLQKSGLALIEYVRHGKRAPKWPVALLPDVMPRGAELRAFIQSVAKGQILADYAEQMNKIELFIRVFIADTDSEYCPMNWNIGNYGKRISTLDRMISEAGKLYKSATGKQSAKVTAFAKQHAELSAKVLPIIKRWNTDKATGELISCRRDAFMQLRNARNGRRHALESTTNRMFAALKLADSSELASEFEPLAERVRRAADWRQGEKLLSDAWGYIKSGDSFMPNYPSDAMHYYKQVNNFDRFPEFRAAHRAELDKLARVKAEKIAPIAAAIAAKNADKLRAWIAGESSVRPDREAGTYARINGAVVETTSGASVPVDHACKLARLYAITVKRGGQQWADGAGPMVGHFRVNSIGADGSLVVGCHAFDAIEAARLHGVLMACPACV